MDPISNKKEFEDLTANLRDLAYSYIEKYSPSKQQTKTYLLKKYLKKFQGSKTKKEITEIIDNIVLCAKCCANMSSRKNGSSFSTIGEKAYHDF